MLLTPDKKNSNRFLRVILPSCLLFAILALASIYLFTKIKSNRELNQIIEFEKSCKSITENLNREIKFGNQSLYTLKLLSEQGQFPSKNQFESLTKGYLKGNKYILGFGWIQKVDKQDKLLFETEILSLYGDSIRIRLPENAKLGENETYFPIKYLVNQEEDNSAIGVDVSKEPTRLKAIQTAIKTNTISCSDPIRFLQKQQGLGFINYIPYFEGKELKGLFMQGYKMEQLLIGALASFGKEKFKLDVYFGQGDSTVLSINANVKATKYTQRLKLHSANAYYTLAFSATDDFFILKGFDDALIILLIGLLLSTVFACITYRFLNEASMELEVTNHSLGQATSNLKSIMNGGTDKIIAIDKAYKAIAYNSVFAKEVKRVLGIEIEEHFSMLDLLNYFPVIEREKILNHWKRALAGEKFTVLEDYIDKNQEKGTYELIHYPILDSDNEITGAVQILRDITDKIGADNLLKANERKFRGLLESAPDAIIIANRAGIIELVNTQAERLFGYEKEELIGQKIEVLIPKAFSHNHEQHRNSFFTNPQTRNMGTGLQLLAKRKDESEFPVEISLSPMETEQGIVVSAAIRDVSERKIFENELKAAKILADEALITKEDFLANMSHEIRTPMNAIIGFAYILSKSTLSEEQKSYVHAIHSSGENLLTIINDILDFSKIEAEMMLFEEISFSIRQLLDSAKVLMEQKSYEKGLSLTVSVAQNTPDIVLGDPVRLTQILINLISNAIKFTETGGVLVSVTIQQQTDEDLLMGFRIADTGIGIETKKLEAIFERFNQASTATNRKFGGTGLGLSIVKKLVEKQHGEIHVKSTFGEGSEFFFSLPFKKANIEQVNEYKTLNYDDHEANLNGVEVLLVEDNLMNQKLAEKILQDMGMKCTIANHGKEALAKLSKNEYDIVLMDIQMPIMDGYTAATEIRNTLKNKTPIMAMTAHAMSGEKEKCLSFGMNDYISKPFKIKDLAAKIELLVAAFPRTKQPTLENTLTMEPVCNLAYLKTMSSGNTDFEKQMIQLYIDLAPADFTLLNKAVDEHDMEGVKQLAHKLKSSTDMVGAKEIRSRLEQMEVLSQEPKPFDQLTSLMQEILPLQVQALTELKSLL